MPAINRRDLTKYVASEGAPKVIQHLTEALETKKLRPTDFSIRDLACAFIEDGEAWVNRLGGRKSGFSSLMEAVNAVDTSQFSSITGQVFYNRLLEGYDSPEFLWPKLVETFSSKILNGERIAGVGGIGDEAETIPEGQPYPTMGVNEEFIDTPAPVKKGFDVRVTEEAIIADHTGLLLKRCSEGGRWLGINKEKRVLDCVLGVTNTYKRNSVATNTYLTSGAYVNSHTNALVDHTDVENAELLLNAINDPNTDEPFNHENAQLLVPKELEKTALRIVNATEVAVVDNQAAAGTHRQWSPAPGPMFPGAWKVLSSPYVKRRSSSSTTWWYGNFRKAFLYKQIWDIRTQQLGANSWVGFTHDIVALFKCSEFGVPIVQNPRLVCRNT